MALIRLFSRLSSLFAYRIDNDILNLMDEFDFDIFLKEISDVIGDSEKSMAYMTERSAILVERFLDYLPRMSIPIERVPLQDGWVLTCRSKDGGDLHLSDLSVLRENLHLSVLGSDNVFVPLSGQGDNYIGSPRSAASQSFDLADEEEGDESVIDEVRELILSAQSHGAWVAGVGGLREVRIHNSARVPSQLSQKINSLHRFFFSYCCYSHLITREFRPRLLASQCQTNS